MTLSTTRSSAIRPRPAPTRVRSPQVDEDAALANLVRSLSLNASRNAAELRPFKRGEFGATPASPSSAHVDAANALIHKLQGRLFGRVRVLHGLERRGDEAGEDVDLGHLLAAKAHAERSTRFAERVWAFYFTLFNQRQSRFGEALLACDRVALDCYQTIYTGLSTPRSVPSPAPFSFMETERTPSTYRRGVKLSKLGKRANPFPIVQFPVHRLSNPWTLGAIHHEVAHNLQSDLGLWREVPKRIGENLRKGGLPEGVTRVWQRWHKETWADLCGVLLGGPAIVTSLFDVLVRPASKAQRFNPRGVHPTPYLRALINLELLRRLGFQREAKALSGAWRRLYPVSTRGNLPAVMLETFPAASRLVVQTLCFEPYAQLGDKPLAEVVRFTESHQAMVAQAARRLAAGNDPGIVPERFLVAAAREALERRYARPEVIRTNFYRALLRR